MTETKRNLVISGSTPCKAWIKGLYPPIRVFGDITDCGIVTDADGSQFFWLEFMPPMMEYQSWMSKPENEQAYQLIRNKHRIVFDGTVRINGRRQSQDAIKVRDAIRALCNSESTTSSELLGIVDGGLWFRCRQVNEDGCWKERWSLFEL